MQSFSQESESEVSNERLKLADFHLSQAQSFSFSGLLWAHNLRSFLPTSCFCNLQFFGSTDFSQRQIKTYVC